MSEFVAVVTTSTDRAVLETIAATLVGERLAACAQIEEPVESVYRWRAEIERAREWRCSLKTRASLFDAIAARIAQLHDYEVPEIVAVALEPVAPAYAAWLREQTLEAKRPAAALQEPPPRAATKLVREALRCV